MQGIKISNNALDPIEKMLDSLLLMRAELKQFKQQQAAYKSRIDDNISRAAEEYSNDISAKIDQLANKMRSCLELQGDALEKLIMLEKGGIK